jgi:hypothetical protein
MASIHHPVDTFLQGINAASLELALSAFTSPAEIFDDGKSFKGEDAIRAFVEHGIIGHKAKVKLLEQEVLKDGQSFAHIVMDGDFSKEFGIYEPFDLFLIATIDKNKISYLDMGGLDPRKPTMRAVYAAAGDVADPLSSIRVHARHLPEPKAGFVRVKMQAVGLNFHDVYTLRGLGMHKIRFPMTLGNEGAGVLDDGTEVAIYPNLSEDPDFKGDETLDPHRHVFGELVQGTLSEYAMVPRRNAVPRPKEMDAHTASVMGIAWLTAYRMMFTRAKLRPGQTVLVQGSSGGKCMLPILH